MTLLVVPAVGPLFCSLGSSFVGVSQSSRLPGRREKERKREREKERESKREKEKERNIKRSREGGKAGRSQRREEEKREEHRMARGWRRPRARGQLTRVSFGGQTKAQRREEKRDQSLYTSTKSHPPPDRPPLRRPILVSSSR